jgi:phosphate transport system permease protein
MSAQTENRSHKFSENLAQRHFQGSIWQRLFYASLIIALVALVALMANVINQAFGYIAVVNEIEPESLSTNSLEELPASDLAIILGSNAQRRLPVIIRDYMSAVPAEEFTTRPLGEVLAGRNVPEAIAAKTIGELESNELITLLSLNLTAEQLNDLIITEVVKQQVIGAWDLWTSLTNRAQIDAEVAALVEKEGYERPPEVIFRSWVNLEFLLEPMSSTPAEAGIRTALLGSIWLIFITIIVAFPIGVGAAIYLQEYATDTPLNRLIETNIRNLAGVPSIIYGLLGLTIFVRILGDITGGRTILSGALTMALLILPVIIINGQEALRAVPQTIREASYGLGATRWQTIWNQVLPAAMPGVLTGTILALSRAIGETAPLIVVGASTFIVFDPNGPLSKFTALPIQIYTWTSRPQPEFRDLAAASIIVLLILLLTLNATAIYLRQRFRRKLMM